MKHLFKRVTPFGDQTQSGETLLSVLVAVALLSFVIIQSITLVNITIDNSRHIELRLAKTLAKKTILTSTDCGRYSSCNGTLVELKDHEGKTIVNGDGTSKYGEWTVQAICQPGNTFEVRAAVVNPTNPSSFLKDPKTKKILSWNNDQGLLIEAGTLCSPFSWDDLEFVTGPLCENKVSGTCEGPDSIFAPDKICCVDGSDGIKPICPAGTNELYAFWDRMDDWGKDGQWVIACR